MLKENNINETKLQTILLTKVLNSMSDEEFSAVAKLSLTNKQQFRSLIKQKMVEKIKYLIIKSEDEL